MDPNTGKLKKILPFLTAIVAGLCVYVFLIPGQQPKFDDFGVYYQAGLKAYAHHTVFDVTGHLQFKYSPFVALLFGCSFSLFAYEDAAWAFYAINAFLCVVFAVLLANDAADYYRRRFPKQIRLKEAAWMALLVFSAFFVVGIRDELKLGQLNLIALLLCYSAFRNQDESGSGTVRGGALLALAIQIKLYCLIFVPLLLFRRAWTMTFFAVASVAVMNFGWLAAFNGMDFAVSETSGWLTSLFASSRDLLSDGYNVSVLGVLVRWAGIQSWVYVIWGLMVAIYLHFAFAMRDADPLYGFLFGMACVLPLNPLAWPYWTILAAPAFVYVLLPMALGTRKGISPARALWLEFVALFYFVFSLQQNQPLSQRWGILTATFLFLVEYVLWFRREVISVRHAPKRLPELSEDSLLDPDLT